MTRIKKRRSGKKKTSDQQRMADGRRRARTAAKETPAEKDPNTAAVPTVKNDPNYKKRFKQVEGGRRGGRAIKKEAVAKEKKYTDKVEAKKEKLQFNKNNDGNTSNAKSTGKTRNAGARRIAAAKSVAGNFKGKPTSKKTFPPKNENSAGEKPAKGFAPWNKNKFKRKDKGI